MKIRETIKENRWVFVVGIIFLLLIFMMVYPLIPRCQVNLQYIDENEGAYFLVQVSNKERCDRLLWYVEEGFVPDCDLGWYLNDDYCVERFE